MQFVRASTKNHSCSDHAAPREEHMEPDQSRAHRALTAAGRLTPHGQKQVDIAKADGRWDAAYAPIRSASADSVPPDLRKAIKANARARKTLATLNARTCSRSHFALTT